jgi:phosphoribosylformylglycinamidine synthase
MSVKLKMKSEMARKIILGDSEANLLRVSRDMHLGLSSGEMQRVKNYFKNEGREPTDVELQAIAQAWSEHCSYKSSKIHLKKYIFGIAEDKVLSKGDAGLVPLDDDSAVAFKIESHNHPSAIEPYGGAATGVGGILRDVLSMGAQPIAVTDVLFFGTKRLKGFPDPKFIENGVIAGIRDYGNRVGIPTVSGGIFYSDFFSPNVLVNVGCVGIVNRGKILQSAIKEAGIKLIIAGGKTGRDGIHGVNMASATIERGKEDISTVQLGSPITKEPLIHAILEANERGLIYALKDLGGGGLSSVVSEMLEAGGMGGKIWLDRVPLKEKDMLPWEIWISESQERMLIASREENVEEILGIMDDWDIISNVIGESEKGNRLEIYFNGEKVLDVEVEFLTVPEMYDRKAVPPARKATSEIPKLPRDLTGYLSKMLSDRNVRTKEFAVRQFDHTVRGATVIGPFTGIIGREGPSDSSVIRPYWDKDLGVAITHGSNPFHSQTDPYAGALNAVDEAVRNLASVGAETLGFSDCLNAGDPGNPDVMGEFTEMLRGLGDGASSVHIPFVSGNVSFYNESGKRRIPTFPTILAVGKIEDINKAKTPDFKQEGNPIYLLGFPTTDLGGSLYYRLLRKKGGIVPLSNPKVLLNRTSKLLNAIDKNMVASVHDVSDGGMAVTISEMIIGSDIGAEIDISSIGLRPDFVLFSEPQSSWVLEVSKEMEEEFVKFAGEDAIKLGITSGTQLTVLNGEKRVISMDSGEITKRWKEGYW